jgi:hypothetical protein
MNLQGLLGLVTVRSMTAFDNFGQAGERGVGLPPREEPLPKG